MSIELCLFNIMHFCSDFQKLLNMLFSWFSPFSTESQFSPDILSVHRAWRFWFLWNLWWSNGVHVPWSCSRGKHICYSFVSIVRSIKLVKYFRTDCDRIACVHTRHDCFGGAEMKSTFHVLMECQDRLIQLTMINPFDDRLP